MSGWDTRASRPCLLHAAHDLGVVEELDGLDHDDAGEAEEGAHDEDQEQEADRGALGAGVPAWETRSFLRMIFTSKRSFYVCKNGYHLIYPFCATM